MDPDKVAIVDYIRDEFAYDGDLDPNIDLFGEQILDSFSIVQVAMLLQEQFDIELEADDLQRENLSTINNMLALVESKRGACG